MGKLIQTIPGENYSRFDDRALSHKGCIVDLGCVGWNWSSFFFDKKEVIGVDPFEQVEPDKAKLFKGVVTNIDGLVKMNYDKDASHISNNVNSGEWVPSMSWRTFCSMYNIDKISILKMNIEGSEFTLLNSMGKEDFSKIDQIIISFHDWMNPDWQFLTESSFFLLNKNKFTLTNIGPYGWYMGLKF